MAKISPVLNSEIFTFNTPVKLPLSEDPEERIISLDEVSWHDSPNDCWIIIYDRVYDITDFLEEHPGGSDILMEYAGRDASVAFRGSGHSSQALRALDRFLIGELPMKERIFRKPGGFHLSDIPEIRPGPKNISLGDLAKLIKKCVNKFGKSSVSYYF